MLYIVRGCKVITPETQSGTRKGTHAFFIAFHASFRREMHADPIKSEREREREKKAALVKRKQLREMVEKDKRINSHISHELI